MKKEFQTKITYVTLKQAEALKKLCFDGEGLVIGGMAKAYGKNGDDVNWTTKLFHCWKPPLDYACKWLRENFDVHVTPHASYNRYGTIYMCTVFYIHNERVYNELLKDEPLTIDYTPPQIFDTYELAQSAGLNYALKEIVKQMIKKLSDKDKKDRLKKIEKDKKEQKKELEKSLANTKKFFQDGKTKKTNTAKTKR